MWRVDCPRNICYLSCSHYVYKRRICVCVCACWFVRLVHFIRWLLHTLGLSITILFRMLHTVGITNNSPRSCCGRMAVSYSQHNESGAISPAWQTQIAGIRFISITLFVRSIELLGIHHFPEHKYGKKSSPQAPDNDQIGQYACGWEKVERTNKTNMQLSIVGPAESCVVASSVHFVRSFAPLFCIPTQRLMLPSVYQHCSYCTPNLSSPPNVWCALIRPSNGAQSTTRCDGGNPQPLASITLDKHTDTNTQRPPSNFEYVAFVSQ